MFIHGLLHGTQVPVALLLGALYIDVQTGACFPTFFVIRDSLSIIHH